MCKRVIATGFALVILTLCFSTSFAQTPYVGVFFDSFYTQQTEDCPGFNVLDELYVAAFNFNVLVGGIQFRILYPNSIQWLADLDTQPVTSGNTRDGIAMGWAIPQNGFAPVFVCRVLINWYCDGCEAPNAAIAVGPHPLRGPIGVTRFPDVVFFEGIGLTSYACPTVPTEETTWGQVKSLYN